MPTTNTDLKLWVEAVAQLTKPERIQWCTGSAEEYEQIARELVAAKQLHPLNPSTFPRSFLYRSDPSDVARTEHLTFVCTKDKETAGPNNNWLEPHVGHEKADALFAGCMQGRTMYILPYCMGPLGSPYARYGVEITDSAYVVLNMKIMTRMGSDALRYIEEGHHFVKGLHSTGDLSPERRLIMHFPDEMMIKSIGSGYGGNALLGKKCHSLRLASYQAQQEGWLAEHMLIVGVENPEGETHYIAAAFPSACGKTNLAMLIPPAGYKDKGWKVWTVGDDIAWIHPGKDGRLYAINPEAGYFGVAPGTSEKTNPNALATVQHDTIFTNVGLTADNEPWWEGMTSKVPVIDWLGQKYSTPGPAAHANSRFTVSAKQCPCYSPEAENPQGVPLSAIVFGGRRPRLIPLVCEAKNWAHGVLMGASLASETTAAATGKVGVLRHDPMAMKPFCGYNFGRYWQHWLSFGDKDKAYQLPKIFSVNWFRQDEGGRYLWPGFGDNIRVLEWIIARVKGQAEACPTAVGYLPAGGALNMEGSAMPSTQIDELLSVDHAGWKDELEKTRIYLEQFGEDLPAELLRTLEANYNSL
jgi:phosphoenolpyruvate carboxykinase (GTP)